MSGTEKTKAGSDSSTTSLKVLAIHRYYWPDTPPYASMLRRIVGRWHHDGHQVDVLSSQPSYKADVDNQIRPKAERIDGVRVERLNLPPEAGRPVIRVLNALRLGAAVFWRAMRRRYDVIMISTAPPVLGGFAASLASSWTGARFIYHCMDIHPEIGRVSGDFSNPWVFSLLRRMDNRSCLKADPVVVLSRDMEKTLRERSIGENFKIKVLNNFSLPSDERAPDSLPFDFSSSRLTFLFAGNIGRFQGLESVVDAMALIKERDDIEFVMMGEGSSKVALKERAKSLNARIHFIDHQPVAIAKAAMAQADAGFVSLTPEMFRFAYPSKTMTYLEQGCPLIVAVEPESELAEDVAHHDYGFTVPIGDSVTLAKLLVNLADDRSWQEQKQDNAIKKSKETYSESMVLDRWSDLLDSEGNDEAK